MRRFQNRIIVKRRLLGASPILVGSAEIAFHTGAAARTVQRWLAEWQLDAELVGKLAKRDGTGNWMVSSYGLTIWLISRGRLRLGPEYGLPDRLGAGKLLKESPPDRFWKSTPGKPIAGQ